MNEFVVGIDLGTTNTLACYMKNGKLQYVRFPGSGKMLASALYVKEDGSLVIGEKAKKMGISDPHNCIRSSKTFMGDSQKKWKCRGKTFSPTDVATEILKEVRRCAVKRLKCAPDAEIKAVITVPAYFNSNQTDETRKAGERAGFSVLQIVTEPMAAAVAAVQDMEVNQKVFVVDLGGGTFDLSVLKANPEKNEYRAIDIDGDRKLGGDDFDALLYRYFLERLQDDGIDMTSLKSSGMQFNDYYSAIGRLQEAAEQAKIDLSDEMETDIELDNLYLLDGKPQNFLCNLTREDFDYVCQPLYDKITGRIKKFLARGKSEGTFNKDELRFIVLAGGSCYIPYIEHTVTEIFGRTPSSELDRSTLVVVGACFIAESLAAGIANSTSSSLEYHDILSHSLGISVLDRGRNVLSKLLKKGHEYPCSATKHYTTTQDYQTELSIEIYEAGSDQEQNDDIRVHDYYGSFVLSGIERAKKGEPNIDVTFSYDASRCLTVTAKDLKTQVSKQVKIEKDAAHKPEVHLQTPMDFMLLIDTSGSMYGFPLKEAQSASRSLINSMIDLTRHRMGLISFDTNALLLSPLTQDKQTLLDGINRLTSRGGTNLIDGLQKAEEELSGSKRERVIIIVTDGEPFDLHTTFQYADSLRKAGIRIIGIGAGNEVNKDNLKRIANPDDAYFIENMSDLKATFHEVVQKLTEKG